MPVETVDWKPGAGQILNDQGNGSERDTDQ